jgi:hypothetical protein
LRGIWRVVGRWFQRSALRPFTSMNLTTLYNHAPPIPILWNVLPYTLVQVYRRFRGTVLPQSSRRCTVIIEAASSTKAGLHRVTFQKTTISIVTAARNSNLHFRDLSKSQAMFTRLEILSYFFTRGQLFNEHFSNQPLYKRIANIMSTKT